MALSAKKRGRLEMQGFACRASPRIGAAEPWLRATPAMSTALIVAGTAAGSELLLRAFAAVSAYVSGGALSLAGLTVASTHFCLGSWLFQRLRPLWTGK